MNNQRYERFEGYSPGDYLTSESTPSLVPIFRPRQLKTCASVQVLRNGLEVPTNKLAICSIEQTATRM